MDTILIRLLKMLPDHYAMIGMAIAVAVWVVLLCVCTSVLSGFRK